MSLQQYQVVEPRRLKQWLHDGEEIALLDVREAGQFGEGHLLLAVPLPYSRLELEIARLVPRRNTRLVLVDDTGHDVASRAAAQLLALGYTSIYVLNGGMQAWARDGFEVFAGVNVPSKVFGELAELHFHTPHISAPALHERLQRGDDVVVLDGRPIPEYKKMSIPTATCCPNGELALRIDDLVPSSTTAIVINCAGRTRSIIGAQTLINLGIQNPVLALENGTQGWFLNDLPLDHGADRFFTQVTVPAERPERVQRAQRLADRFGIARIDATTLAQWWADPSRTTYLCDVRSPEEARATPIQGAQCTPGGQLIQATDQYVATRGARLVVTDDDDIRAPVVATWLYMLGWDVVILPAADAAQLPARPSAVTIDTPAVDSIDAQTLAEQLQRGVAVWDVRSGMQYRQSHIDAAIWVIRPTVEAYLNRLSERPSAIVLVATDAAMAALIVKDLHQAGVSQVSVCLDAEPAWRAAGLTVVSTPDSPSDAQCIDYLFFVHDRHDGNKQAARQYLAWETNLISQLDDQEKAMYRFQ